MNVDCDIRLTSFVRCSCKHQSVHGHISLPQLLVRWRCKNGGGGSKKVERANSPRGTIFSTAVLQWERIIIHYSHFKPHAQELVPKSKYCCWGKQLLSRSHKCHVTAEELFQGLSLCLSSKLKRLLQSVTLKAVFLKIEIILKIKFTSFRPLWCFFFKR